MRTTDVPTGPEGLEATLRPELAPLPERLKLLPVRRGYPVPWFVDWVDGEPEFRAMDPTKWKRAVRYCLCWVCGQQLGRYLAFVLGPMCGITRTTVEPACHRECALWSILNCPFLSRPQMVRRELEGACDPAGFGLMRNPGATLLWMTHSFEVFHDDNDRPLLSVGEPLDVEFYYEGRRATRAEIEESVAGLPSLRALADQDREPEKARADLAKAVAAFERLLP